MIGKLIGDELPPFTLAALRWVVALLVVLPFIAARRARLSLARGWWPTVVVLGVTGVALYTAFVYLALRSTSTLNASIIQAAIPMVTALLAALVLGTRVGGRAWLGMLAAFVGVAWIVSAGQLAALLTLAVHLGDAIMVANVFLWAIYTLVGQRIFRAHDSIVVTFYAILVGLAVLWPIALWEMRGSTWPTPSGAMILALLYIGIFPSVAAYVLWNRGVAAVGASRAAVFVNLLPAYTAVLAALVLGERIALHHVVGGLLVAGGVYWGSRGD